MNRLSPWATAAAIVLFPCAVMATAVISESIEQMTNAAPMIVRGQVGQVQPQLDERHGRIYTYADVQVTEALKGPKLASVLVKTPGGELGGRGQRVSGAERFATGQDTVLFLEPAVDEPGVWIVRALAAGKVDLEKSATGELRAVRHLEGLAFFEPKGAVHVVHPEEDLGTPEQFFVRLAKALKAGAR